MLNPELIKESQRLLILFKQILNGDLSQFFFIKGTELKKIDSLLEAYNVYLNTNK